MSSDKPNLLRGVAGEAGPFLHAEGRGMSLSRIVLLAATVPAGAGMVVFGLGSVVVLMFAATGALLGEIVTASLTKRRSVPLWEASLTAGVLLGLTLPADAPWSMAMLGGVVSSVVGYGLFGGYGNHLWHPALVGRAAVQVVYADQMSPASYGLLGRGHLLWGNLANRVQLPVLGDWWSVRPPMGKEAWDVSGSLEPLMKLITGDESLHITGDPPMLVLVRDLLPDWGAALLGLTGGGIGETCVPALLITGMWLMYRGVLRWELPVSIVVGAAVAAALLPVYTVPGREPSLLPGFMVENGVWLGGIYVAYHLICGELILCAMIFAADSVTTPLTRRGQIIFGALVGGLTIMLRLQGIGAGACYWALLLMNTLVPVIDRWTKRRVLGA